MDDKHLHTPNIGTVFRRRTSTVSIGNVPVGGDNPVAVQSMTNCSTLDTQACIRQIGLIRQAGGRIVRLTAQGKNEAENLDAIARRAREEGYGDVALVADIHFNASLAQTAARLVDKVRINPGNYKNTDGNFTRLLDTCKDKGTALRIGVNHGSLAGHIVEKWGDTPRGMVESAMEYLRECRDNNFDRVVVSMKSSNVRVMVHAYRLLVRAMEQENMVYPLHLGVTEAGDGDYGRVKSAAGIGALLADGIGDTIRVSLTEAPENEIPVAESIVKYISVGAGDRYTRADWDHPCYDPFEYGRRASKAVGNVGGINIPVLYGELDQAAREGLATGRIALLEATGGNNPASWRAQILNMQASGDDRPVILHKKYRESESAQFILKAATDFGLPFLDGLADGLWIENIPPPGIATDITEETITETALSILQATRVRTSKPEYIACPGCGRTLFDLQPTLAAVRERTCHLKGLKIGVMGCIVNGPGEMADADYGYVGAGPGRITLYKSKEPVLRNIPQEQAVDQLVKLLKDNGDWTEPAE